MMKIGHEGLRPHVEKVRRWDQKAEEAGFLRHFELDKIRIIQVADRDVPDWDRTDITTDETG